MKISFHGHAKLTTEPLSLAFLSLNALLFILSLGFSKLLLEEVLGVSPDLGSLPLR
jgi:hypothetical protein